MARRRHQASAVRWHSKCCPICLLRILNGWRDSSARRACWRPFPDPNIAAIYGLEDSGETHALVLELVPGPTLQDRISQGAIPLDEALPIAKQIAEALEAAHEQGIIHRDLKPANIKVTPDGVVKVLDFGLAKATRGRTSSGSGMSQSPTMTTRAAPLADPVEGAVLGTAAYMSPEQEGGGVDKRSDIWSFGVILYELPHRHQPLFGETATDSIGAVLHKEPDLDELPAKVPAQIRRLLERCLAEGRQPPPAVDRRRADRAPGVDGEPRGRDRRSPRRRRRGGGGGRRGRLQLALWRSG